MPFAIFRRHQRKLIAVFGILAMIAFVLSDALVRFSSGGGAGRNADPVVVKLWGKTYRQSDLHAMKVERGNANVFMTELIGQLSQRMMPPPYYFGDLSDRSIVDALILEHEADRLRMPRTKEVAQEWLRELTNGLMRRELFEAILSRFNNRISGEELLAELANQIRIMNVRTLLGNPVVTPLDVYQTYLDQNERVSAKAVEFRVEDYVSQVKDPSDSNVRAYYDKYKDVLPDPDRATPGFKVPRQIRLEILAIDSAALAREIQAKLTDAELLTYFENRKADFIKDSEFPPDIFANDPEASLTPPLYRSFAEVKTSLAISLAEEKAQEQVNDKFSKIADDVLEPFAYKYLEALDEIEEAKKEGSKTDVALPKPTDLKVIAEKEGLDYDKTPLLSRDLAEHYGQIHDAEYGSKRFSGGRKFADEFFAPKSPLFSPVQMTSPDGRRYLVRKIEDDAPHIPSLSAIREEVVHAWKEEQARPIAEKAAEDFAAKLRKDGVATLKNDLADGHRVIVTDPVSKMQPGILPGQFFATGPAAPTEITQFPHTGDALRDALFGLQPDAVTIAPNQPLSVYYVLTLNKRIPATFDALYAPNSDSLRYKSEVFRAAAKQRDDEWMNELRLAAKLPKDWAPPENKKSGDDEAE